MTSIPGIPRTVLQHLLNELIGYWGWVHDVVTGEETRRALIADLGGTPADADRAGKVEFPPPQLESIKAYRDAADPTLEGLIAGFNDVRAAIASVRAVLEGAQISDWATNDELVHAAIDLLTTNYVRLHHPRIYFLVQVVNFTEESTSVYGDGRHNYGRFATAFGHVLEFVLGPLDTWNLHLRDDADAQRISNRTWQVLAGLLAFIPRLGADDVLYGADLAPGQPEFDDPTALDKALGRTLTLKFGRSVSGNPLEHDESFLLTLCWVPESQGGPALFMSFGGNYRFDRALSGPWHLIVDMDTASAVNTLIGGNFGFKVHVPGAEGAAFKAGIALEARPDALTGLSYDLSPLRGFGLQFGLIRIEAGFTKDDALVQTTFRNAALTLAPKAFDNFLAKLIPGDGLRVGFDFALGHSAKRGSYIEGRVPTVGTGGARPNPPAPPPSPPGTPPGLPPLPQGPSSGISLGIPIGKSLGPVTFHNVNLRVGQESGEKGPVYLGEVTTSASVRIGPVTVRVERFGLKLEVTLPADDDATANLGFMNLDVAPRTPDGIAVGVDAKGIITGGGFLFHDRTLAQYAGVLQLAITFKRRFTLTAFGLLSTKLPDGSNGYSFVVFITADEFTPFPLGGDFRLAGFGGMLAINRTFDQAALREGLKNKTLGNLLFPKDPIRRAPEIIHSLATVFPAKPGRYLFGPLAKILWGRPDPMVTFDLAAILEWGSNSIFPSRLIVLGRISSILPSPKAELLRLNLDTLGLVDFDEGRIEFDAVLVDSRLARKFVLTGSAALRMNFGRGPGTTFALSVGGLHPRFAPPVGFPKLDRITIALASGDNPRITCSGYWAITANTIQYGAHASLYAAAGGFSVEGEIGYDVLIQPLAFRFLADFHASVQLKRGSRNLFKVVIDGALEGVRPLRVSAKVTFEILWLDFTIRVDKTLIAGDRPPLPPAVNVIGELKAALADGTAWSTLMPSGESEAVVLRKLPPGASGALPVLHPLGRLAVRQQVVPLNTERDVDTYGGAPVAGDRRFSVTRATLNGTPQSPSATQDLFVPTQFFEMSDDEKLAAPSFESRDNGVVFGSDTIVFPAAESVDAPLVYESIVIDDAAGPAPLQRSTYTLSPEQLAFAARANAVASAPVRTTGAARFHRPDAEPPVRLTNVSYVIASTDAMALRVAPAARTLTWSEARAALREINRADVAAASKWQVLPAHEVVA